MLLILNSRFEVEKKLLEWRWNFIEELSTYHYFDLEFLVLYLLKLQILEKLSLFDKERGLEKFKKTISIEIETESKETEEITEQT